MDKLTIRTIVPAMTIMSTVYIAYFHIQQLSQNPRLGNLTCVLARAAICLKAIPVRFGAPVWLLHPQLGGLTVGTAEFPRPDACTKTASADAPNCDTAVKWNGASLTTGSQ